MKEILKYIEKHGKADAEEIATALSLDAEFVKAKLEDYEERKIISGYSAIINWENFDEETVSALIEVKITPQMGQGFDRIASKIYQYDHVKSVYLMSAGHYDLSIVVEGRTLKEVAMFVAEKLAPMEFVTATSTHFILKRYKENGVVFANEEKDIRQVIKF